MSQLPILPLLVPLSASALLLLGARAPLVWQRALSLTAMAIQLLVALWLLQIANTGHINVYLLGDWPAPFGIVLVLDRLAALMVVLAAVLASGALLYAVQGDDREGTAFHALFQFQLLGLNGAFLTGDLFNLFVFFEILLLSSYGLLLHGAGPRRIRAGLHYVVLNLIGSSLFLLGIGILYGVTGSLNMADIGQKLVTLDPGQAPIAKSGILILLTVFALKAAVLPLHFWLPHAYGAATASVAALFAVMTKVGIYAIVRVLGPFTHQAGPLSGALEPWLGPASLLTLAAGTFGAMASRDLRQKIAYLVMVSVGVLLIAASLGSAAGLTGALFYLIHTTLVTAALFLVADLIARGRTDGALITPGERPAGGTPLALLFFVGAVAVIGMPPLSGLVGKVLILNAARDVPGAVWIWGMLLTSGLLILISFARAGSDLFWRGSLSAGAKPPTAWQMIPAAGLLAMSPLMVVLGGPVTELARLAAEQIHDTPGYVEAVLGQAPASPQIPQERP